MTVVNVALGAFALLGVCFAYYQHKKAQKLPLELPNDPKPRIVQTEDSAIAFESFFSNTLIARIMLTTRSISFAELIKLSLITSVVRKKFLEDANNRLDLMRHLILNRAMKLCPAYALFSTCESMGTRSAVELAFQICDAQNKLRLQNRPFYLGVFELSGVVMKVIEFEDVESADRISRTFSEIIEHDTSPSKSYYDDWLRFAKCKMLARQDNGIDEAFEIAEEIVDSVTKVFALRFIIEERAKKSDAHAITSASVKAKTYRIYEDCIGNFALIRARKNDPYAITEALHLAADQPSIRFQIYLEDVNKGNQEALAKAIQLTQNMDRFTKKTCLEEAIVLRANQVDTNAITEALELADLHLPGVDSCFVGIALARMKKNDEHAMSEALQIIKENCLEPRNFIPQFIERLPLTHTQVVMNIAAKARATNVTFDGFTHLAEIMVKKVLDRGKPSSVVPLLRIFNHGSGSFSLATTLLHIAAFCKIEHLPEGVEFTRVIGLYNSLVNVEVPATSVFTRVYNRFANSTETLPWKLDRSRQEIPKIFFEEFEKAFATNTQEQAL